MGQLTVVQVDQSIASSQPLWLIHRKPNDLASQWERPQGPYRNRRKLIHRKPNDLASQWERPQGPYRNRRNDWSTGNQRTARVNGSDPRALIGTGEMQLDNLGVEEMWGWNHCHCLVHVEPHRHQVLMNLKSIYIKPFRLLVHSSQFKLGFLTFAAIKVCIINYFSFKIRLSKGTSLRSSVKTSPSKAGGLRVWFLVRELRSHMPQGQETKT